MEGCAGEVMGDILDRVGGKEEVGCRIGDVKRLFQSAPRMDQGRNIATEHKREGENVRPIEPGNLGKGVNDCIF